MTDFRQLEKDLRSECRKWWRDLNGIDHEGKEDRARADRKARAELRRVGSDASDEGDAVNLIGAYSIGRFMLFHRSIKAKHDMLKDDGIALAAAVLAHVDADPGDAASTAKLLGEGEPPLFAEQRFKRLIRTDAAPELLLQMVRAVKILGKKAPVGELGASLLLWGPAVKKRWAFAYWQREFIPAEPANAADKPETRDPAA